MHMGNVSFLLNESMPSLHNSLVDGLSEMQISLTVMARHTLHLSVIVAFTDLLCPDMA